jgi:hypothetical protein
MPTSFKRRISALTNPRRIRGQYEIVPMSPLEALKEAERFLERMLEEPYPARYQIEKVLVNLRAAYEKEEK